MIISAYKALRVFMRGFNNRNKCTCRYNLVDCAKVIKVSGNGVISVEGYAKCARFTDKMKLTGKQIEKAMELTK